MNNMLAIPALQRIFGREKSNTLNQPAIDDAVLKDLNKSLEKFCKEHNIRCEKATESPKKSDPLGIKTSVKGGHQSKATQKTSSRRKQVSTKINNDDELIK